MQNLFMRVRANDRTLNLMLVSVIAFCSIFWIGLVLYFGFFPAEDSFILFRYADNLAHGFGIVWNQGGPHSEGATDFLWMVSIAFVTFITSSNAVVSAYMLGAISLLLIGYMCYWFFIQRMGFPPFVLLLSVFFIILTPIVVHILNGFSPPLFSLLLGFNLMLLVLSLRDKLENRSYIFWSFTMLLCGLTRPDGNSFNIFVVGTYCWYCVKVRKKIPSQFWCSLALLYVLPGIIYFAWRYAYFQIVFPLPFYVKSGSNLLSTVGSNIGEVGWHILPPMLAMSASLIIGKRTLNRETLIFSLVPIWLFLLVFMLFNQTQNVLFRFQYPCFFMLILLACTRFGDVLTSNEEKATLVPFILLTISTVYFTVSAKPVPQQPGELTTIGKLLSQFKNKGYLMAITEAGRLPYFSGWKSMDSYGLTDPFIATHGLTYDHWKSLAPSLTMIHYYSIDSASDPRYYISGGNRKRILECMRLDATWEPIAIVKVVGRNGRIKLNDYNFYFLRSNCPDYELLKNSITSLEGVPYVTIPSTLSTFLCFHDTSTLHNANRIQSNVVHEHGENH